MVILDPAVFSEVTVPEHCEVFHKISHCKNFKVVEQNIHSVYTCAYKDITCEEIF